MQQRKTPVKAAFIITAAMLLAGLMWVTCSQKNPLDPTSSLNEDVTLLVDMASSAGYVPVGGGQAQISVRVVDKYGNPQAGQVVNFTATLGQITLQDSTDSQGYAYADYISGQTAGTATIQAIYDGQTVLTLNLPVIHSSQPQMQVLISDTELLANGVDRTQITVTVFDDSADAITGGVVFFESNWGEITPSDITDESGSAKAYLTGFASTRDTVANVTVRYDTLIAARSVNFTGIQLLLTASPTILQADGQSTAMVSAHLKKTTSHIALMNAGVSFGSSLGSIENEDYTNSQGIANVTLTSGSTAGTAEVVAYYGNTISDTVLITMTEQVPSSYTLDNLSVDESTLLANGTAQTTVSVSVYDNDGFAAPGITVQFSASSGSIQSQAVSDANGLASVTLTAAASATDLISTIIASLDAQAMSAQVSYEGVSLQVGASPASILADGISTSRITALLKRTTSNVAVTNADLIFGTSLGTVNSQAVTSNEGVATVVLTSTATVGTAQVVAMYGPSIRDTVDVEFSSTPPSAYTMSALEFGDQSLLANGIDKTIVQTTITDDSNDPVEGLIVTFSTTAGSVTAQAVTDENGTATGTITASASGSDINATVTAALGSDNTASQIPFYGVTLTLTAAPNVILADGQSKAKVTALVKRSSTNVPVSGATVSFGTDLGIVSGQAETNSEGVAQVNLTSGTVTGTAEIIARYGNEISDTTQVVFQESVPSYLEVSVTPKVISADGQSQAVINATVTDVNHNPVPDGTTVQFNIIEGTGSIQHQRTTTDGIAASMLTAGTLPDTAHIRIGVASLSDTVQVIYKVGDVDRIVVSSVPDSLPADGVTKSTIAATVLDGQDNPVEGVIVSFNASFGDIITSVRTNSRGVAATQYSSTQIGLATITAQIGEVSGFTTVQVYPGPPFSITLSYNPGFIYVRDCGKNQTVSLYADVRDEKNNPVEDGTYVKFSIYASPGEGDALSTTDPIPTVGGVAQISYTSGVRPGTARIQAQVTDSGGSPVSPAVIGLSTEIVIYSGPPYIEDSVLNDSTDTHLTVVTNRLNIWAWVDTTLLTVLVGDKYNNPVQEGTAVYLTTAGGVVTTKAYTNENGLANFILESGNPQPTIDRYYGLTDPNLGTVIPGPIADFENSQVVNSEGGLDENDGITRVLAYTEGVDSSGNSALVWDCTSVVFSRSISHFQVTASADTIRPGQFATIDFEIWDLNGNPIVSGSTITASYAPSAASAELSWNEKKTGDPGQCYYGVSLFNIINPTDPEAQPGWVTVTVSVASQNGNVERSVSVYLDL